MLALWRGWLPSVIGVIPYVGLNFAVYETSKDAILSHYGAHAALRIQPCVATGFGVRVRIAYYSYRQASRITAFILASTPPGNATHAKLDTYPHTRRTCRAMSTSLQHDWSCRYADPSTLVDLTDERDLSVVTRLACGAFASTFGQTVAYPLDVVRRRLQVILSLFSCGHLPAAARQQYALVLQHDMS